MISKEEYVALYSKYLRGNITADERVLLESYTDDMGLNDDTWDIYRENELQVKKRIWKRLETNINNSSSKPTIIHFLLKVAAALLIISAAGVMFLKYYQKSNQVFSSSGKTLPIKPIVPGGNKAVLTMADGSVVELNDVKNGKLVSHQGISINKTSDGVLVYQFDKSGSNSSQNEHLINTVTTPRGGKYQIILEDGTKVWLNAASSLKFPIAFSGPTRTVELDGEGYFEVAKNKNHPFIVNANGTTVKVLGTHFNVSAYKDDNAVTTTLLKGSVRLTKSNLTTLLVPGQQGTVVNGSRTIAVVEADIDRALAWKDGIFLFKNMSIKKIMKQASRWYDVDINYEGDLTEKQYGGKISKYGTIDELLHNLELTGTIHFKVEGRRITVMP